MIMRHIFEHYRILIDQFYNVVELTPSSWLFQSKILFFLQTYIEKSVCRSLGLLHCIRIWHDNSGQDSSSSWFLKYIIVRDLQTMEKFNFISQRWFAAEKEDGKVHDHLDDFFSFDFFIID